MRSRSRGRLHSVAVIGFVAALAVPLGNVLGALRTSNTVIVPAGETLDEDLISLGGRTIVEGTVTGDVFVVTGELRVTGTVGGDVTGLVGGDAVISGEVGGSIRVAAVDLEVTGSAGDDVLGLAVAGDVSGEVGRDVMLVIGSGRVGGTVGRDVLAQAWSLDVDAAVGRDVEVRVDGLTVGGAARVEGHLQYRASREARVADGAVVEGELTRSRVLTPVWARAVSRWFAVLSLVGFVVAGLIALWLFRRTVPRSTELVAERPWVSGLVGLAAVLLLPLMMLPLFLSLLGIPVAIVLLLVWLAAIFIGPAPAIAWAGSRVLRGRGGLAGGLVVGAVVWRFGIWMLPLIGAILYVIPLLVGLGAFVLAGWEQRRMAPASI